MAEPRVWREAQLRPAAVEEQQGLMQRSVDLGWQRQRRREQATSSWEPLAGSAGIAQSSAIVRAGSSTDYGGHTVGSPSLSCDTRSHSL